MAAGLPVVSTSIQDVVRPYGQQGLVRIADDVPAFVRACVQAMAEDRPERITRADAFLRRTSWDGTWLRIQRLVDAAVAARSADLDTDLDAAIGTAAV
jgi:UDP-galactopyranose mutase